MTHSNIVFVCKSHHIYSLIREIGTGNSLVNNKDITRKLSKDKILENHQYFFSFFCYGILSKIEEPSLLSLTGYPK